MPGQQPAERGLARAGRADHGQPLARRRRRGRRRAARRGPRRRRTGRRRRRAPRRRARAPDGLAVVGHLGDAQQPGQRGRADLQLVDPERQPVDRVDQLLHVQRGRGDLAERRPAPGCSSQPPKSSVATIGTGSRTRPSGTRPCAGTACTARPRTTRAMSASVRAQPRSLAAAAPRRCGRPRPSRPARRVMCGVRRALPQVAVLGPRRGTTGCRRPAAARRAGSGSSDPPADQQRARRGEHRGDDRDRCVSGTASRTDRRARRRRARSG